MIYEGINTGVLIKLSVDEALSLIAKLTEQIKFANKYSESLVETYPAIYITASNTGHPSTIRYIVDKPT